MHYLSQNLQKYMETCLGIPSVMSTLDLRQDTHRLDGLGAMGTPHSQHRLKERKKERKEGTKCNACLTCVWRAMAKVCLEEKILRKMRTYILGPPASPPPS